MYISFSSFPSNVLNNLFFLLLLNLHYSVNLVPSVQLFPKPSTSTTEKKNQVVLGCEKQGYGQFGKREWQQRLIREWRGRRRSEHYGMQDQFDHQAFLQLLDLLLVLLPPYIPYLLVFQRTYDFLVI